MYAQQGAPLWLYREGMHLPGNYTAFAMDQPHDYSMSVRSPPALPTTTAWPAAARLLTTPFLPIVRAHACKLCKGCCPAIGTNHASVCSVLQIPDHLHGYVRSSESRFYSFARPSYNLLPTEREAATAGTFWD